MSGKSSSPFKILSKSYSDELINREQYVKIRTQLLKKLQQNGTVTEADLEKAAKLAVGNEDTPRVSKSYSASDWCIIGLGIAAAVALASVLYN